MPDNQQYKKELMQIYYRYIIPLLVSIFIYFTSLSYFYIKLPYDINLLYIFVCVFIANTVYLIVIKFFPSFLKKQRIYIAAFFDVLATFLVMLGIEVLSPFLSFLFLWYIVGYGTKYGLKLGIFVTICVNIAWIFLITYTPFWRENSNVALGWLLTFVFIPIYFLNLVSKLQKQYEALHINYSKTEYEARHDFLTKLINRSYFEKKLLDNIAKSIQNNSSFAIIFIDLDGFKTINDNYGHDMGDEILIEVAKRLETTKEKDDIVARLGGDEFVIISQYSSRNKISSKASDILKTLSQPYKNNIHTLSASIGISIFPKDTNSLSKLKRFADMAMYHAKQHGKSKYCFYSDISNVKSA